MKNRKNIILYTALVLVLCGLTAFVTLNITDVVKSGKGKTAYVVMGKVFEGFAGTKEMKKKVAAMEQKQKSFRY